MTAPSTLPTAAAVFVGGLALGTLFALLVIASPEAGGTAAAAFFGALFCIAAGIDIRNTWRVLLRTLDPVDDEDADREADRYERDWRRQGER